jgi:hypothetical protein
MTQRSSSDGLDIPTVPLSRHLTASDGWTGSLIFHGRLVGMVDGICGAFSSRKIFLRMHATSS